MTHPGERRRRRSRPCAEVSWNPQKDHYEGIRRRTQSHTHRGGRDDGIRCDMQADHLTDEQIPRLLSGTELKEATFFVVGPARGAFDIERMFYAHGVARRRLIDERLTMCILFDDVTHNVRPLTARLCVCVFYRQESRQICYMCRKTIVTSAIHITLQRAPRYVHINQL